MISTIEKVLFLRSADLFGQIHGEDLVPIAQIAQEVDFKPHDNLITEGEIGETMYLILSGWVQVLKGSQLITRLGSKECVGEMAILDSEPRSATVRAEDSVQTLKIERADFFELMAEKPEIARGVIKVLIHRLRDTTAQQLTKPTSPTSE